MSNVEQLNSCFFGHIYGTMRYYLEVENLIVATHLLLELFKCRAPIADAEFIEETLLASIQCAELTPLHQYFHDFDPPGVTGIVALKESHISIHTWPALSYTVVDFLTCGNREKGLEACRFLEKCLEAEDSRYTETRCVTGSRGASSLSRVVSS